MFEKYVNFQSRLYGASNLTSKYKFIFVKKKTMLHLLYFSFTLFDFANISFYSWQQIEEAL
jgi:hypothetical protein